MVISGHGAVEPVVSASGFYCGETACLDRLLEPGTPRDAITRHVTMYWIADETTSCHSLLVVMERFSFFVFVLWELCHNLLFLFDNLFGFVFVYWG